MTAGRTGPPPPRVPPIAEAGRLSKHSDIPSGLRARAEGQLVRFLTEAERAELREFAHLAEITLYRPGRLLDKIRKQLSSDAGYNEAEALFDRLRRIALALRAIESDMEEAPRAVDGRLPMRPASRTEGHHDGPFEVDRKSAAAGERGDD